MRNGHEGWFYCPWSVLKVVLAVFFLLHMISGASSAQAEEKYSAKEGSVEELLVPLQTLHNDLSGIEAKLDSFANTKWEYKVLIPNVLGNSDHDQLQAKLGPLGMQGWELVTYSPDVGYILKRRVLLKP